VAKNDKLVKGGVAIDDKQVLEVSKTLRALSHPLRLKIIAFIDKQKETNVNQIYSGLKIEQSITSQQLKILRDASLVFSNKVGKVVFYSLNYQKIATISKVFKKFQSKLG